MLISKWQTLNVFFKCYCSQQGCFNNYHALTSNFWNGGSNANLQVADETAPYLPDTLCSASDQRCHIFSIKISVRRKTWPCKFSQSGKYIKTWCQSTGHRSSLKKNTHRHHKETASSSYGRIQHFFAKSITYCISEILDWNTQGYRRRGRLKRTRRRTIEDEIRGTRRLWHEVKGIAGDHINWKLFMDALCSTRSKRTWWWYLQYLTSFWSTYLFTKRLASKVEPKINTETVGNGTEENSRHVRVMYLYMTWRHMRILRYSSVVGHRSAASTV
jgi:hypothetical protein